jgi:hypothetical protein
MGSEPGLYDKENNRLLLMNLTSSYSAFCVIKKYVNIILIKNNQNIISFGEDQTLNLFELKRFFSIIESVRFNIFNTEEPSTILKYIVSILDRTHCLGRRNEEAAKQIINTTLGADICRITSGGGMIHDIKLGVDAIIKINNIEYKAQIKPFKLCVDDEDYYHVIGSSSTQDNSNVDLLVFVNVKSKTVKIFETKNMTIHQNKYIFPKPKLLFSLTTKNGLELIDCKKYL